MRIAVVGGKLQGVETCYLARKAGWQVRLVDRCPDVLARGLCDEFIGMDICRADDLDRVFGGVDLVLPALENKEALDALLGFCAASGRACAFDPIAYEISSSKIVSDRLFAELGLPIPRQWPEAAFPLIAKPSGSSGSKGIRILCNRNDLVAAFPNADAMKGWVVQEYLEGPSYSIEVIGFDGSTVPFQITDLYMDADHDCKRVTAPTELPMALCTQFMSLSKTIAEAVKLKGIMDVEVILNNGQLKVLEIDARIPSQTPTVVFWSSGLNLVEILGKTFLGVAFPSKLAQTVERAVIYEHIRVSHGILEVGGEHLMTQLSKLHVLPDFFGADEALTDFKPGRTHWGATLIICDNDRNAVWQKRYEVLMGICRRFGIERFLDLGPILAT
jgi:pyrrolysine biosynthesis protein PylC